MASDVPERLALARALASDAIATGVCSGASPKGLRSITSAVIRAAPDLALGQEALGSDDGSADSVKVAVPAIIAADLPEVAHAMAGKKIVESRSSTEYTPPD